MTIPPDLNPILFVIHAVLGLSTILFVAGALFSTKGSRFHRRSGQLFAIAMGVAAATALAFMFSRPSNFAICSALLALYGLGAGILTLRARRGFLRVVELVVFLIPWLVFVFFGLIGVTLVSTPNDAPVSAIPTSFAMAAFALYLAISDIAYLRSRDLTRHRRLNRHAIRFAIAAAEVVRAPLITFAPRLFGEISLDLYFIAPLVLVPVIYFLARPGWLRNGASEPALAARSDVA